MPKITTQKFLEIDKIKEGIIILKNKTLRGILMVSSINFALKSEEEQKATIYQFQNFLNSLDFSTQIIVQSRRLNITGYLDGLKKIEKEQENELLKIQTTEYIEFVKSLVEKGTIMSKSFFVVVPFNLFEGQKIQTNKNQKEKKELLKIPTLTEEEFQRGKSQTKQRLEFVSLGLRRCGLKAVSLNSTEIIELFWSLHHPQRAETGYYPEIPPEFIK